MDPASRKTPGRRRKRKQRQGRRLGDAGVRNGISATNGGAEVCPPCVVAGLSSIVLAPNDVVGRVDRAVAVEIASRSLKLEYLHVPRVLQTRRTDGFQRTSPIQSALVNLAAIRIRDV